MGVGRAVHTQKKKQEQGGKKENMAPRGERGPDMEAESGE